MPVSKVPVTHKFGIISHTQRQELQERLLKQSYLHSVAAKKGEASARNPLEVSEEFIHKFNAVKNHSEKDKCEKIAYKMLERVKRRVGLKDGGSGTHVDLPIGWTELSQLAQCKGKVQEDCLDVLITSLDQAPLSRAHIPALFFLSETCLYWLHTDAVNQPYLRTGEIKLLKMGQLVFTRLFHHHMAGGLRGYKQYKNRLYTYLDGLSECQDAYNPYPDAMLSLRYINEVGKIIVSDVVLDPGGEDKEDEEEVPEEGELFHETSAVFGETKSSRSGALSSSVHDLSPSLWHALDVYRCCTQLSGGLTESFNALSQCGQGLASENWVDGVGSLIILAESAKANIKALKVLQNLARGVAPSMESARATPEPTAHVEHRTKAMESKSSFTITSEIHKQQDARELNSRKTDKSHACSRKDGKTPEAINDKTTRNESGVASSMRTYTNAVFPDIPGIHGWHWEVAFVYTEILSDICLHGSSSMIQKTALIGNNKEISSLHKRGEVGYPLQSAGLLDLAFFHAKNEVTDGGRNDWSWRIRYGAIQGLVKICRCCAGDNNREGLRNAAWDTLIKINSLERDERVMEALKVGQVGASIEHLLSQYMQTNQSSIGTKIAVHLCKIYLPPLPPPVDVKLPEKRLPKKIAMNQPVRGPPLRTSLKDEISLATALYEPPVDFKARTSFDLKRIVEDQWRKELQRKQEQEEKERLKNLEENNKTDK